MMNEDWQTITIGGLTGAMVAPVLSAKQPGTVQALADLPDPLSEKPVLGSLVVGGLGLGLAYFGSIGKGPIARNRAGINFSAALGAASLGGAITMAMYPTVIGAAAKATPGIEVTVGGEEYVTEAPEGEITLFGEEEAEAATPSGEALGGI